MLNRGKSVNIHGKKKRVELRTVLIETELTEESLYTVNFYRMIIGRLVVNPMYFLYNGNSYKMATFIP